MYFSYIIQKKERQRYYTGSSHDINVRIDRHNAGAKPSTKFGCPRSWSTQKALTPTQKL